MDRMWLGLVWLVALQSWFVVNGLRKRTGRPERVLRFYAGDLLTAGLVFGGFTLLVPAIWQGLDFSARRFTRAGQGRQFLPQHGSARRYHHGGDGLHQ